MLSRRNFLSSVSIAVPAAALSLPSLAQDAKDTSSDGIIRPTGEVQTQQLQTAISDAASASGSGFVTLANGRFLTQRLMLPSNVTIVGGPRTELVLVGDAPLLIAQNARNVTLSNLRFNGQGAQNGLWHGGLVHFERCKSIVITDCAVSNVLKNGFSSLFSSTTILNCRADTCEMSGIFMLDSTQSRVSGCTINDCHNGGIRIWRERAGVDGTQVTENHIKTIGWTEGGNGQNGNGINVYRADNVVVANNVITDCAFSAIRLNGTNNTSVTGNQCINSGEVGIFSEFKFSGSIIANNHVINAAAGISITNYNEGGQLAICTGNIVRNISGKSEVNPDSFGFGIAAEANTIVANNIVDNVEGYGIWLGWGEYLADVTAQANHVSNANIGITISVVEGAGAVSVLNNTLTKTKIAPIAAMQWHDLVSSDASEITSKYPHVIIQ